MLIPQILHAAASPTGPVVRLSVTAQSNAPGAGSISFEPWYSKKGLARMDMFGLTLLHGFGNADSYFIDRANKVTYKLNHKLADKLSQQFSAGTPSMLSHAGAAPNGTTDVYLGYRCRIKTGVMASKSGPGYYIEGTTNVHGLPVSMFALAVAPSWYFLIRVTSINFYAHTPPGALDLPSGFKIVELNEKNFETTLASTMKDTPKSLTAPLALPVASPPAASPAPLATPALSPPAIFPGECPFAVPGGGWAYAPPGTLVKLPDGTTFTLGKNSQQ